MFLQMFLEACVNGWRAANRFQIDWLSPLNVNGCGYTTAVTKLVEFVGLTERAFKCRLRFHFLFPVVLMMSLIVFLSVRGLSKIQLLV